MVLEYRLVNYHEKRIMKYQTTVSEQHAGQPVSLSDTPCLESSGFRNRRQRN